MTVLLETRALSKSFGGLQAVRHVDFRLGRGEIRAVIGPNGAGKTTLVGMISGRLRPTSGRVLFQGRDITRVHAWDRVALGIVYTFQITSIFKNLSVYDNVALAVQRRLMQGPRDRIALAESRLARGVAQGLAGVGLARVSDEPAGALPHGHQKLLEIAMALALEPRVLILDEPTQGLAPDETAALSRLIRDLTPSVTILLIEHNMAVVLDLAESITVMDKGGIIAEGTPAEIETHAEVQKAYLGL